VDQLRKLRRQFLFNASPRPSPRASASVTWCWSARSPSLFNGLLPIWQGLMAKIRPPVPYRL